MLLLWCRAIGPDPVMPEFNVTQISTRVRRGGCVLKNDFSWSTSSTASDLCAHGQAAATAGGRGLPGLCGDHSCGQQQAEAWVGPFLPLGNAAVMRPATSIPHPHPRAPHPQLSACRLPCAPSGDKSWQGTRACHCGQAAGRGHSSGSQLCARPAACCAAWGPLTLGSHMLRGHWVCSPPASLGHEPLTLLVSSHGTEMLAPPPQLPWQHSGGDMQQSIEGTPGEPRMVTGGRAPHPACASRR